MILHPNVTDPKTIKRFKTLEAELYTIHGDTSDFTDSVYAGMNVKMKFWCNVHMITCKATPANMTYSKGCKLCGYAKISLTKFNKGKIKFKPEVELKHPDKYDLTMVWYRGSDKEVMIWCKKHQKFFWIRATDLLRGKGCNTCGNESIAKKLSAQAKAEFAARAELKHPSKFGYDEVEYVNSQTRVKLLCKGCDVYFWIRPNNLLNGNGHSGCSGSGGFKSNLPATLYYLRVESFNQIAWKIGITNLTVEERFKGDMQYITILSEVYYENGQIAFDEELCIKRRFKEFQYKGDPILKNGNTELFDRDVLELDLDH